MRVTRVTITQTRRKIIRLDENNPPQDAAIDIGGEAAAQSLSQWMRSLQVKQAAPQRFWRRLLHWIGLLAIGCGVAAGQTQTATFTSIISNDTGSGCSSSLGPRAALAGTGPWTITTSCGAGQIVLTWSVAPAETQVSGTTTPTPSTFVGYPSTYFKLTSGPIHYDVFITAKFITPDTPTTIQLLSNDSDSVTSGPNFASNRCSGKQQAIQDVTSAQTVTLTASYSCSDDSFFPTSDQVLFNRFFFYASMAPDKQGDSKGVTMAANGITDVSFQLQGGPPAADKITVDTVLPVKGDRILAVADTLPPFCASGSYSYSGNSLARIYFAITDRPPSDRTANVIAVAPRQDLPKGSGTYGGGCTDPKTLMFIPPLPMPAFTIPQGSKYDTVLGTYYLQAILVDSGSGKVTATSDPITYSIIPGAATGTVELKLAGRYNGPERPEPDISVPTTGVVLPSGRSFAAALSSAIGVTDFANFALLSVVLDFGGTKGRLDAEIDVDIPGSNSTTTGELSVEPKDIQQGHSETELIISGAVDKQADFIVIQPRLTTSNGQVLLFNGIHLPVESVAILTATPDPGSCSFQNAQNCLTVATSNTIQIKGSVIAAKAGKQLVRLVDIGNGADPIATITTLPSILPVGQATQFTDTVQIDKLPANVEYVDVQYQLQSSPGAPPKFCSSCAADYIAYRAFTSAVFSIGAAGVQAAYNFGGGSLSGIVSKTSRTIRGKLAGASLASLGANDARDFGLLGAVPSDPQRTAPLASSTAATNPDFAAISKTWTFDPPIAHDGSFSATLALSYAAADFPDDPNFIESKIQIVGFDTSGTLHVYSTTLDLTNKVATAVVDGLDPYFSLAVLGPFSQTPVILPTVPTSYALVNTGTQDSTITVTSYSAEGAGAPTSSVIKKGQRQQSNGPAWLQAWSSPSTVSGVSWFDDGVQFGVIPASLPAAALVLTDIEYDKLKSIEVDVANVAPVDTDVTFSLFGSDGGAQGKQTIHLTAKNSFSSRVEGLFPAIKTGFTGYLLLSSRQKISASGVRWTNTTTTGLTAQPVNSASLAITSWYAPQLGGPGSTTTLHLVNTSSSAANLTLRAYGTSGTPAASNVAVKLASGQTYTKSTTDVFGIAASTVGSIEVDSDTAGVFGDVLILDSSFIPGYAISVPLTGQTANSLVLPYATSQSTISVFNPNSKAANITVTPYTSAGTAGTASKASIPAFGRASVAANAPAYATIGSDQPVVAMGTMITPSGATTGYLATAAPVASGSGSGAGGPQISAGGVVNAASYTGKLARGSLATIFGSNFTNASPASAASLPLPTSLAGVSLSVGGVAAPLIYVSASQINFQVPYEVPAGNSANIVVTSNGSPSPAVNVAMSDYAVGVFTYARTAQAVDPIIVHSSTNALVTPSNPAVPNEFLVVYATGIGKLNNPPHTGTGASGLATAVDPPTITIGGTKVSVPYAGLTPGFPGLVQFNIQMPANINSGSLPLIINFPGDASTSVNLAVQGTAPPSAPQISVTPSSLDFGQVNVKQSKDLTYKIANTGNAPLIVSSISSDNPEFVPQQTTTTLGTGSSVTYTVRFTPSAGGAQQGTLTIFSNDASQQNLKIAMTGSGVPTSNDTVLQVDGGAFNSSLGYLSGVNTAVFLNRLTPPSYPATLKSVQIYFGNRPDGLAANTAISIVEATNPSGSSSISPATTGTLKLVSGNVGTLGGFTTFAVPPVTITSGDFLVGFLVANPKGIAPADLDQLSASQKRSYSSGDGLTYAIIDSFGASTAGNFGIRAVVTLGNGTSVVVEPPPFTKIAGTW